MENHTQNIALINNYLNKLLTADEVNSFENRLLTDDTFKKEYDTHVIFLEGLKRYNLKTQIRKAKHIYFRNKWFKYLTFIILLLVILTYIIFSFSNSEKNKLKSKLNFESEYVQLFLVTSDSMVHIIGEKGTRITFNPNDLQTITNQAFNGDSLTIELIELTTKQDLLLANAQTVSNDEWLVSGGAFKIEIKSKFESLILKKGKTIHVQLPKTTAYNNMQLFYGKREKTGRLNWELSNIILQEKKPPFVIFLEESYIIDTVLTIKYDINHYKSIFIVDSLGHTPLDKKFPKLNYFDKELDTIRFYKKSILFMASKDPDYDDYNNKIMIDSMAMLKNKKEIIIDSTLFDLEDLIYGEGNVAFVHVYQQISKKILDELNKSGQIIHKVFYKTIMDESRAYKERTNTFYKTLDKVYKTIQLSKLGWINIDRFAQDENKVNVKLYFNIKTNYNAVYLVDQKYNTMLNVDNNQVDLPVNRSFYIIALGIKGKDIYGFKKSVRVNKSGDFKIEYKKINEKQIKSILTIENSIGKQNVSSENKNNSTIILDSGRSKDSSEDKIVANILAVTKPQD